MDRKHHRMGVGWLSATLGLLTAISAAAQEPDIRVYRTLGDVQLHSHVFRPDTSESRPAVLLFHGGGWNWGEPEWTYGQARAFQARGLVAISVQYRLAENGITPVDAVADACASLNWVRASAVELGVDPSRVAGYGVSAGGQVVSSAALGGCGDTPGPDLLMLWSPAVDLANDGWFQRLNGEGAVGVAAAERISPLVMAAGGGPATIIIEGEADTLTPAPGVRAFCDRLRRTGSCDLNLFPGLGHLLTRNIANQESDFDIDPEAARDGRARLDAFLVAHGYLSPAP